ncbi:hypothetical protein E0L93_09360 [Rubrobacter taiwanensis]|jgi:hypothetical protein|uniref:Uncharacterized protein n=1 Tax=Rubrobacter taiwanensis TaxID=185139 RepID=A0A4V2NWD0_9ACTN|nr:hypothetical protein [Rubrobacter taiwanensis]TCJ16902.1 hypothetical protein E0L93_09360 [Rubrobacter taiwanensis]
MVAVHYRDAETGEQLGRRFEEVPPRLGERVSLDGAGDCLILYYWELRPESCDVFARRIGSPGDTA